VLSTAIAVQVGTTAYCGVAAWRSGGHGGLHACQQHTRLVDSALAEGGHDGGMQV
jgi:hypothetical protein